MADVATALDSTDQVLNVDGSGLSLSVDSASHSLLDTFCRKLPLSLQMEADGHWLGVNWACSVGVPVEVDVQIPKVLFTLVDQWLPSVVRQVSAQTAQSWKAHEPRVVQVRALRKGSWMRRSVSAPGLMDWFLCLSATQWPAEDGGWLYVEGEQGVSMAQNQLYVIPGERSFEFSLLTRHHERLLIAGRLETADSC